MERQIRFGPFLLDEQNERLWEGSHAISIRPKAFAVLKFLVGHPGRLITKQQLLDAVWPATFVGDAVLKDSIRQLRDLLHDDAESPRYIETAHRRGYRFIAQVAEIHQASSAVQLERTETTQSPSLVAALESPLSNPCILGRTKEVLQLRAVLAKALRGDRQLIFITGEPGIGKTTLVNAFVHEAVKQSSIWTVRGQCLEQYGSGEAYLPVLDGLSRLCRGPDRQRIISLLQQFAPTWLAQMPSVLSEREPTHNVVGASRERMLREMADAVELMSAEKPMVFVLEDLHWSDYSTLDLMSFLARHRDPARVMVIGTYRPVEVILGEHRLKGLKQELRAQGLCTELALEYLTEQTVAQYLSIRFPGHQFPRRLARLIHKRTEGNPLFMVNVAEYLAEEDLVRRDGNRWVLRTTLDKIEAATPESLRNLIEKQIERLSEDERTVLEGAAVVGLECSTAAIAAGLERDEEWVEEHCEKLVKRHQFLTPAKVVRLPDGTLTRRHKFTHVLFLEVPYSLIPDGRRRHIHRRIGDRGELIYGARADEIAAELAMHFEEGQDFPRAAKYLVMAAENAARCSAHHEAAALAWRGLSLLELLPKTSQTSQHEMTLQMILGVSVMATKGFASAETEQVYLRAKELYWLQGPSPQLFSGLWLLGHLYFFRGSIETAMEVSDQMLQLAVGLNDSALVMQAELAVGATLVELGRCADAMEHLQRAASIYESNRTPAYTTLMGHDCKVISESYAARALWALGYPDQALDKMNRAEELAQQLSHAQSLVAALHFGAELHLLRGESSLARRRAESLIALAEEYGLELWLACGNIDLGWAEVDEGHLAQGIERLRRGLSAHEATGARLWRAHFLALLARALAKAGHVPDGLSFAQQAIESSENGGESYFLAELHRVKGEILLAHGSSSSITPLALRREAQNSFERALGTAKQQKAKSWELRAAMSCSFDEVTSKRCALESTLRSSYEWFKEGHATSDLRAAKSLLEGTQVRERAIA